MDSGKGVVAGTSVAAAGEGAGVAMVRETDGDETFSGAWVGEGKLVAVLADEGDEATVGSGGDVGTVPEHADPTTAANAKIDAENRIFKIWYGLLK